MTMSDIFQVITLARDNIKESQNKVIKYSKLFN